MSFPAGTQTKTVNLTYKNAAEGKRVNGSVRLTPNVLDVAIDGNPVRWTGGGTFRFDSQGRLLASDGVTIGIELLDNSVSGTNPHGWMWEASITIDGKTRGGFFSLEGVDNGVDLNTLLEINPATPSYVPMAGPQGIQGIQGLKGDPGIQGIQGLQGIQGIPGVKGDPGTPGLSGGSGSAHSNKTVEVVITDDDFTGLPEALAWTMVRTSGGTDLQASIEADPEDRIEVFADFLYVGSHYMDWVLKNGTGEIGQFGTGKSSTPPSEGSPGLYPILTLSKHAMTPMFAVESNHIDGDGKVTIGLAHIGSFSGSSNRVYAHPTYPFSMRLKNIGPNPA